MFTVANPDVSHRSKHLEVRYYKIREYVRDGLIDVKYVKTNRNVADFFTKGLEAPAYRMYRKIIMNNSTSPSPKDDDSSYMVNLRSKLFLSSQCLSLFSLPVPEDTSSFFGSDFIAMQSLLAFGG